MMENAETADPPVYISPENTTWKELSEKFWTSNIGEKKIEPTLVLSVIGDSDSFVPKPWSKSVFHTALMEAAKSGGVSWIIYKGKKVGGVSCIVQEAYSSYVRMESICQSHFKQNVQLISIANDHDEIETDDVEMCVSFESFIFKQDVSFFRKHLDLKMPVPIVIVALEGGLTTVQHIAKALDEGIPVIVIKGTGMAADLIVEYLDNNLTLKRKATVLLGISFNTEIYTDLHKNLECIDTNRDLVSIFDIDSHDPLMFSNLVGEAVVNAWGMKNILNKSNYVDNVYSNEPPPVPTQPEDIQEKKSSDVRPPELYISSNNRMQNAIRKVRSITFGNIMNKKQSSPDGKETESFHEKEMESTGQNFRTYVLNSKFNTPTSLPLYFYFSFQIFQEHPEEEARNETAKILLLEALKANRTDYVQVLLDKKITIENKKVAELYRETLNHHQSDRNCSSCIQWILTEVDKDMAKHVCFGQCESCLTSAQKLARMLLGYKEYKEMKRYSNKIDDIGKRVYDSENRQDDSINKQNNNTDKEKDRIFDMLLWAIFANRPVIAEICWIRGNDHLLTALICTTILRKLSKKAGNIKEQTLCKELKDHSQLFQTRALSLLDLMYETHQERSTQLIDKAANVWGIYTTPLTFAHENFMYDVVAHPCSQKNLNYVWYNTLTPDIKPFLKSMCSCNKFLTAPLTKYIINYIFYTLMLVTYSGFVLTSIDEVNYSRSLAKGLEYYVYFWGLGDLINEMINIYGGLKSKGRSHRKLCSRIKRHFNDFWNIGDFISYALLIIALFVRHLRPASEYQLARRLFSLSLLVMYLRFLQMFLMFRRLGPILIMIKEMLKDLLHFLVLAVFVVIGVGIYYHANLWPDHTNNIIFGHGHWTDWRIWKVLYYPYWQLYGEIFNDYLEGKDQTDCTNNSTIWLEDPSFERCPQEEWSVSVVTAGYMLFSNLLLVNLVIAMFSYTFERVQNNAEKLWRFERYTVITDYERRIPSPFNLAILPFELVCYLLRRCSNCCGGRRNQSNSQKEKDEDLSEFERILACKLTDKN